jgi:hypothetical protein
VPGGVERVPHFSYDAVFLKKGLTMAVAQFKNKGLSSLLEGMTGNHFSNITLSCSGKRRFLITFGLNS